MRTLLVLTMAAVMGVVVLPNAEAFNTTTGRYTGGNGEAVVCDPGIGSGLGGACFELDSSPTQSLDVTAFDDLSTNVGVTVRAYNDAGDLLIDSGPFCTFWSPSPTEQIPSGITRVEVLVSPQGLGFCTGTPTTGTVHLSWT